jgi:hypothetical protein
MTESRSKAISQKTFQKRPYIKPELTSHGSISKITRGGFSAGSDAPQTGFLGSGSNG